MQEQDQAYAVEGVIQLTVGALFGGTLSQRTTPSLGARARQRELCQKTAQLVDVYSSNTQRLQLETSFIRNSGVGPAHLRSVPGVVGNDHMLRRLFRTGLRYPIDPGLGAARHKGPFHAESSLYCGSDGGSKSSALSCRLRFEAKE